MARTASALNNPLSGNIGNQTFKNYQGQQVVVSRFRTTSAKGEGASYEQRLVRLQLPNIVLAGSQLKKWLPCLFEQNKFYATPYTHFISHNKNITLPVQPKSAIESKHCHWGNLVVSCGSLPSLTARWVNLKAVSSISYHETIDNFDTTVAEFSRNIIRHNPQFRFGDYLVILFADTSMTQPAEGSKRYSTTPNFCYVQLSSSSSIFLDNVPTLNGLILATYSESSTPQFLAVNRYSYSSVAFIQVRKVGNKYLASSASMVLNNDAANYCSDATSDAWIEMCAETYGFKPNIL